MDLGLSGRVAVWLVFGNLWLAASLRGQAPPPLPRDQDPNDWQGYYERGFHELRNNEPFLAESYFAYAARLEPSLAEPLLARYAIWWRARPYLRNGLWVRGRAQSKGPAVDTAEAWFREALLRNPFVNPAPLVLTIPKGRVLSNEAFGRALHALFRTEREQSINEFSTVLGEDPDDWEARRWRGLALAGLGRWQEAARDFDTLIARITRLKESVTSSAPLPIPDLYHTLGLILLHAGDTARAKSAFQNSFVEDLAFYMGHMHYGMLLWDEGDTTGALREYALAIELRPDDEVLRVNYGTFLLQAGRADSAKAEFAAAIRLNPDYAVPYFNGALALERIGDAAEARRWYENFLTRAPRRMAQQIAIARQRVAQ